MYRFRRAGKSAAGPLVKMASFWTLPLLVCNHLAIPTDALVLSLTHLGLAQTQFALPTPTPQVWLLTPTCTIGNHASPLSSRRACLKSATAEAKLYRAQICRAQVGTGKGIGRAMPALGEEVEAATTTNSACNSNSSSHSTTSFTKGANGTAGGSFPKSLPNSTYEQRTAFLNALLEQGQQGTLINSTAACDPWTAYFDFVVQLMSFMLGNIGSGIGRMAGASLGQAAGASIGQSGGFVVGAAASTVVMPAEEAVLGQVTGPGGQGRGRRGRGLEQRGEAKPAQGQGQGQGQKKSRQRRRRRQQQGAQPLDDATVGLAGASGIGLGTGFAIGTPAGAAAGRVYGEKIGEEVALWIINNANFAITYFGTLVLADVMNGVDIVVTNGIKKVKIQKIVRSQVQAMEDQIFLDFKGVYNATVYADFVGLEAEAAMFESTMDAFRGMGALFGFAAGMQTGAAVGASSGGIYGSAGAGAASGAAQAAGPKTRTMRRKRKAQTASSSFAEKLAAIDPLVALAAAMWMGTSIGVGSGTSIGVGAGIYGGWQLFTKIGYGMGILLVKFLVKAFALFQQVYGQVVVDQIEQAIFDASAIRINLTYTPTCSFSNYTYPIKDIAYYLCGEPSAGNVATGVNEGGAQKPPPNGPVAASSVEEETAPDLAATLLKLLGHAATPAGKGAPPTLPFYSRTAASFFLPTAETTGTKAQQIRAAYNACQSYAMSEMHRAKTLCYLSEL